MSDVPSIKARLAIMTVSSLFTVALCEAAIRVIDGNATPMIRLFESDDDGTIHLEPNGTARIARAVGQPWEINTDANGHRIPTQAVNERSWIAVGDSQVMGNGVNDTEPFPALLTLDGSGVRNLGVPGYGIGDALWSANEHLATHPAGGVIVIVNQMNDWDEVNEPVGARYRVRGGWLIDADDAEGPRGHFLASPLSSSHLFFLLGHLALKDWDAPEPPAPTWMTDPASMRATTLIMTNAINDFARQHPSTPVLPVYMPADIYATPERATASPLSPFTARLVDDPWSDTRLRDQVMTALADLNPIDLTPVLNQGEHFLMGDYHLSATGHAAVAAAINAALASAQTKPE